MICCILYAVFILGALMCFLLYYVWCVLCSVFCVVSYVLCYVMYYAVYTSVFCALRCSFVCCVMWCSMWFDVSISCMICSVGWSMLCSKLCCLLRYFLFAYHLQYTKSSEPLYTLTLLPHNSIYVVKLLFFHWYGRNLCSDMDQDTSAVSKNDQSSSSNVKPKALD